MKTNVSSTIKAILGTSAVVAGLAISAGPITAATASLAPSQAQDAAAPMPPAGSRAETAILADDRPEVFVRSRTVRTALGMPGGVQNRGLHVKDGSRKTEYDEVTETDSSGQPLSLTQLDASGRLLLAVRFDEAASSQTRVGRDAALKKASDGLAAAGIKATGEVLADSTEGVRRMGSSVESVQRRRPRPRRRDPCPRSRRRCDRQRRPGEPRARRGPRSAPNQGAGALHRPGPDESLVEPVGRQLLARRHQPPVGRSKRGLRPSQAQRTGSADAAELGRQRHTARRCRVIRTLGRSLRRCRRRVGHRRRHRRVNRHMCPRARERPRTTHTRGSRMIRGSTARLVLALACIGVVSACSGTGSAQLGAAIDQPVRLGTDSSRRPRPRPRPEQALARRLMPRTAWSCWPMESMAQRACGCMDRRAGRRARLCHRPLRSRPRLAVLPWRWASPWKRDPQTNCRASRLRSLSSGLRPRRQVESHLSGSRLEVSSRWS